MKTRFVFTAALLSIVLTSLLACGSSQSLTSLEATRVAEDKATMEALATAMAGEAEKSQEEPEKDVRPEEDTSATPLPPPTPVPSSTPPMPDTPPGSVLEVGQSWQQGELEIKLKRANSYIAYQPGTGERGPIIALAFDLTSRKSQDVTLRYNLSQALSASDNRGRALNFCNPTVSCMDSFDANTIMLHSGETVRLLGNGPGGKDADSIAVLVDAADPLITEVVVTISVDDIENAQWRIPIPH